jgi:predicted transcriptional regulator
MAMTLRTDSELENALSELSASEGLSRQEIVKRAVLERHQRAQRRSRLDGIVSDLLVEYDDALRRLGSV